MQQEASNDKSLYATNSFIGKLETVSVLILATLATDGKVKLHPTTQQALTRSLLSLMRLPFNQCGTGLAFMVIKLVGDGFDIWSKVLKQQEQQKQQTQGQQHKQGQQQNLTQLEVVRELILTAANEQKEVLQAIALQSLHTISSKRPDLLLNSLDEEIKQRQKTHEVVNKLLKILTGFITKHSSAIQADAAMCIELACQVLDPHEPHLRKHCTNSITQLLQALVQYTKVVSFCQQKQRIAVAQNNVLLIYDLRTASKWRVFEGHGDVIKVVSFAHAGKQVVTYSQDNTIRIWQVENTGFFGNFLGVQGKHHAMMEIKKSQTVVNLEWDALDKSVLIHYQDSTTQNFVVFK